MQWPTVIVPCSWGSGGALCPQQFQGRALMEVQGGKPPEALDILQFTFAKNAKTTPSWSIYPLLQFYKFCGLMS